MGQESVPPREKLVTHSFPCALYRRALPRADTTASQCWRTKGICKKGRPIFGGFGEDIAQSVECLPSISEAVGSILSPHLPHHQKKKKQLNSARCGDIPIIKVLWRPRQEDHKFEVSLGYLARHYF